MCSFDIQHDIILVPKQNAVFLYLIFLATVKGWNISKYQNDKHDEYLKKRSKNDLNVLLKMALSRY